MSNCPQPINLRRHHPSGAVTADSFPRRISFTEEFLDDPDLDPSLLKREDNLVTLNLANGQATYELGPVEHDYSYKGKGWRAATLVRLIKP